MCKMLSSQFRLIACTLCKEILLLPIEDSVCLTLSMLGKNSGDDILEYVSYIRRKKDFDISCKLSPNQWRQFARNVKSCFLRKLRTLSLICLPLNSVREW